MRVSGHTHENGLPYAKLWEDGLPKGLGWDDFRIFLAVVQSGSVNRAAMSLGLAQATASRRLTRLEKQLGVRLFDRDRTGPRLTHHGRQILNDVAAAGDLLGRAARGTNAKSRIQGECRIVIGDGLAIYWLPLFLPKFYRDQPNVDLKVFVAQDSTAGKNEAYDVQFHYYEPVEVDPVTMRVATMHFVPFASRTYLERHPIPKSVRDLAEHRLLEMSAYRLSKGPWSHWLKGVPMKGAPFLTNQSAPLAEAVRQGVGIALLPTYIALTDPSLVPLDIGVHLPTPVYMSFQRDVAKKWSVRATLDFFRDIVFQRKAMPWFSDEFIFPTQAWTLHIDDTPEMISAARARHLPPAE